MSLAQEMDFWIEKKTYFLTNIWLLFQLSCGVKTGRIEQVDLQ